MKAKRVFKIRNTRTGEYSGPGHRWSKQGKAWSNIGHLKNHLHYANGKYDEGNCVLEVYELAMVPVAEPQTLDSVLAELEQAKQEQERLYQERRAEYQRQQELRQLADLKRKYGEAS